MITFSIIQKSQLEESMRIDAEFYEPEYLLMQKLIEKSKYSTLQEASKKIVNFGAYSLNNYIEYLDEGAPFLFVGDIRENYIDLANVKYIDEKLSKGLLHKSLVTDGQVLLTIAGTIGNAAVSYGLPSGTNSNQAIANIYPKKDIDPYFLASFLNCKYGKMQSKRYIISNVQPNLLLTQVKRLLIPLFNRQDQQRVAKIVRDALLLRNEAIGLYKTAEKILLDELDLGDFQISDDLAFEVNFSDVENAGRMDADYFQPKYEKIVEKIRKQAAKSIGELSELVGHAAQSPYDEMGNIAVVAQNHMKGSLEVDTSLFDNYTSEDLIKKNDKKFILKKGDVLISSAGEPGLTCVWLNEYEKKVIPGSFVTIVRFKNVIDPLYAGVFLNTIAGRVQFERDYSGSVQQYVYPVKIKEIIIPILLKDSQQKIADLVRQSHEARRKSKELLEEAKRKVEKMIEKGGEK